MQTNLGWFYMLSVTLLVATGSPAFADAGLAAAYDFSELSGPTTADGSGNGNTGAITGATWSSLGFKGDCLSFNGGGNCVSVSDSDSLDLTSEMTLEAWVNPTTLPLSGEWRIIDKRVNTDTYMLAVGPNYVRGGFGSDDSPQQFYYAVQNTPLPINRWTHLAVTFDGVQVKLYVNGSRAAICDAPGKNIRTTGESLYLARDFIGRVDQVRIYNRAKTDKEVASAVVRLHLGFDEGTGAVAHDGSDYGNNGDVVAASWISPQHTIPIADSVADFTGPPNGGNNGWYYFEWADPSPSGTSPASAYDYTTVNQMVEFDGTMWHGSFTGGSHYPYIGATIEHPAGPNWPGYNLWAVRRWVSTVTGTVYIYGRIAKNALGGTGVNGHIYVDGVEKWSQFIAGNDGVGVDYSINVAVGLGSKVDFALDSNGDVNSDETIFTSIVDSNPPPVFPGSLQGTITLSNYGGRMDLVPVEVTLSQGGVNKYGPKIFTSAGVGGNLPYSFTGLAPGTYDVSFSASRFLRKVVTQEVPSGPATLDVSLISGDLDGDNYIGTLDFSILSGNFGRSGN